VRAGSAVGGEPFRQHAGRGAYAYDAQGRSYVDYLLAYGPLLFGHAHPAFTTGLDALAARGTVFGSTHDEEIALAERIRTHLPAIERLRFTSTGTEAMMSAIRTARAFTERETVIRFAGNYHGHFDAALHDAGASAGTGGSGRTGIPDAGRTEMIVARYNDLADLDARIAAHERPIAAIAVEPVVGNMGLVLPEPGFVAGLRTRADALGAVLVFDEVITWLRLGLGGGQAWCGVRPDLVALGKIMGGGYPLAAFGGRAEIMAALAPQGAAFTGGTFSGNPFSIAMGHRVLDLLEGDRRVYARLAAAGGRLADGLRDLLRARELPYAVNQLGSMVGFAFRPGGAVRDYDDARSADAGAFAAWYHAMRGRGVLLAPSQNELMFLSTEHGERELARTLAAADASLAEIDREGVLPR